MMADRVRSWQAAPYIPISTPSKFDRPDFVVRHAVPYYATPKSRAVNSHQPPESTVGSNTRRASGVWSRASSPSTATSSTPSLDYDYELPCVFVMLDCNIHFHPSQRDTMFNHQMTHLRPFPPPQKTMCSFCPLVFENPNIDSRLNWRHKLDHEEGHYRQHVHPSERKIDYFLYDHLRACDLIAQEDYDHDMAFTERYEGINEESAKELASELAPLGSIPADKRSEARQRARKQNKMEAKVDFEKDERRYLRELKKKREGKRH